MSFFRLRYVIVFFAIIFISSCGLSSTGQLRSDDLFSIPLGTLPGELDWFYRDSFRMAGTADIHVWSGLVYISGGAAGRVMVFNSYGDLLTYIYDPRRNPAPAVNQEVLKSTEWSFQTPGRIVGYEGGFLVEDNVTQERQIESEEFSSVFNKVVLRFDQDGNILEHLGREGLGGTPFPYISSLDIREDGGIVVTCRVQDAWLSYWYSSDGRPTATVLIQEDQLLELTAGERLTVISVRPDPVNWSVHVRLDSYLDDDPMTAPQPRLYTLDLTSLEYTEPLQLQNSEVDSGSGELLVPPDYLGTTIHGNHVFISPQSAKTYQMTIMDPEGRIIQNRRINIDSTANVYWRFRLQNNGLLAGVFFGHQEAQVSWWRVDRLLEP